MYSGFYDDGGNPDEEGNPTTGTSYFSYAGSTEGLSPHRVPRDRRRRPQHHADVLQAVLRLGDRRSVSTARPTSSPRVAASPTAEALIDLMKDKPRGDAAAPVATDTALKAVADFYNTGFDSRTLPSDPSLYLSSGPYIVTDVVEGQSVTMVANDKYDGDFGPKLDEITVRTIADPSAMVQALQNGEVDVISPQANADTLASLEGLDGVEVHKGNQLAYDHIDLNFSASSPTRTSVRRSSRRSPARRSSTRSSRRWTPRPRSSTRSCSCPAQDGYADAVANNGSGRLRRARHRGCQGAPRRRHADGAHPLQRQQPEPR